MSIRIRNGYADDGGLLITPGTPRRDSTMHEGFVQWACPRYSEGWMEAVPYYSGVELSRRFYGTGSGTFVTGSAAGHNYTEDYSWSQSFTFTRVPLLSTPGSYINPLRRGLFVGNIPSLPSAGAVHMIEQATYQHHVAGAPESRHIYDPRKHFPYLFLTRSSPSGLVTIMNGSAPTWGTTWVQNGFQNVSIRVGLTCREYNAYSDNVTPSGGIQPVPAGLNQLTRLHIWDSFAYSFGDQWRRSSPGPDGGYQIYAPSIELPFTPAQWRDCRGLEIVGTYPLLRSYIDGRPYTSTTAAFETKIKFT